MIGVALALALAAADWVAVGRRSARAEAVLKPLVPLPLLAVAAALHQWWFAAALALCLVGDVLLLPSLDRFRAGLAAFLLGHLAFIAGFWSLAATPARFLYVLPAVLLALLAGPRIVRAAPGPMRAPIVAYLLVLVAMFGSAWVTGRVFAVAGAALFLVSDAWLAWNRFVDPLPGGRLVVMVTYHLALCLLTLSLLI